MRPRSGWAGTARPTRRSEPPGVGLRRGPLSGHPFAQTHPDRLATLATLFGLGPAAPERCRVLELGCGDAGNLVPIATGCRASFVGFDAAPGAIARGRRLVTALGLDNVTLEARTLEDFAAPGASFDYVIAHGVYSWVAPAVRDRLLALCRNALPTTAWPTSATTPCPADACARRCATCSSSTPPR